TKLSNLVCSGLSNRIAIVCSLGASRQPRNDRAMTKRVLAPFLVHARFDLVEARIVLPDPFLDRADFTGVNGRASRFLLVEQRPGRIGQDGFRFLYREFPVPAE